jgi:hypothetical protein
MKKILGIVAILACAACSSTPAKETTVSSDIPNSPAAAQADATATKGDAKKVKEAKSVKQSVAPGDTATASSDATSSEFGTITGTEKSSVTCTNKGDTRTIKVLNVEGGGCGVVYNKSGADKTVAMAKNSLDHCDNVSNKIKTNLEGAGYDCGGGAAAPEAGTSSDTQKQ